MFERIRRYYEEGLWNIHRVWNVVGREKGLTEQEYEQITGFVYPDKGEIYDA